MDDFNEIMDSLYAEFVYLGRLLDSDFYDFPDPFEPIPNEL